MKNDDTSNPLKHLKLGQSTEYQSEYAPELLQSVPRALNRKELGIIDKQPFTGQDVWHAYELSWLNNKGKPVVALGRFSVTASSPNIFESKSCKLYLNSLNQTRFDSHEVVQTTISRDLSQTAGSDVKVELFTPDNHQAFINSVLPGYNLDKLDIGVDDFTLDDKLISLHTDSEHVNETLHSHLLKSNCLITNQPDWASVIIHYSGSKIKHESLLRYLISFRNHNEFHEQCVERIFCDIQNHCKPDQLSVQALYTRRGGLDINPFRTSLANEAAPSLRINRQ